MAGKNLAESVVAALAARLRVVPKVWESEDHINMVVPGPFGPGVAAHRKHDDTGAEKSPQTIADSLFRALDR